MRSASTAFTCSHWFTPILRASSRGAHQKLSKVSSWFRLDFNSSLRASTWDAASAMSNDLFRRVFETTLKNDNKSENLPERGEFKLNRPKNCHSVIWSISIERWILIWNLFECGFKCLHVPACSAGLQRRLHRATNYFHNGTVIDIFLARPQAIGGRAGRPKWKILRAQATRTVMDQG